MSDRQADAEAEYTSHLLAENIRLTRLDLRWQQIHHELQNRLTDHRFAMFDVLDAWDHDNTRLLDTLDRMRKLLNRHDPAP